MTRRISDRGAEFIARAEGLRLSVYQDPAGIWTIGYGHTGPAAAEGNRITEAEARRLLRADLATAERAVADLVKRDLTDDQFAALVSLTYNIGRGAFTGSTCLRRLNAGDESGALEAWQWWTKAGGRTLAGLVRRRAAETRLWQGDPDPWTEEFETAAQPESTVRESLADSRTIKAAGAAALASVALPVATGQGIISCVLLAAILLALAAILFARWRDREEGRR